MSTKIKRIHFFLVVTLCILKNTNYADRSCDLYVCVSALASIGYEKTCVLFNVGALASQIAAEQNLDNDEGLKAAAKFYQVQI